MPNANNAQTIEIKRCYALRWAVAGCCDSADGMAAAKRAAVADGGIRCGDSRLGHSAGALPFGLGNPLFSGGDLVHVLARELGDDRKYVIPLAQRIGPLEQIRRRLGAAAIGVDGEQPGAD